MHTTNYNKKLIWSLAFGVSGLFLVFLLGFLLFFIFPALIPFIGLLFGIQSRNEIKQKNQKGLGWAYLAILINSVNVLMTILVFSMMWGS